MAAWRVGPRSYLTRVLASRLPCWNTQPGPVAAASPRRGAMLQTNRVARVGARHDANLLVDHKECVFGRFSSIRNEKLIGLELQDGNTSPYKKLP